MVVAAATATTPGSTAEHLLSGSFLLHSRSALSDLAQRHASTLLFTWATTSCKRFLELTRTCTAASNLRRFEKRIDEMKAMAREVGPAV